MGFRIMAEAGMLPEEITFKRQDATGRAYLATLSNPGERKAAVAELARIEPKQAMADEARRVFMKG